MIGGNEAAALYVSVRAPIDEAMRNMATMDRAVTKASGHMQGNLDEVGLAARRSGGAMDALSSATGGLVNPATLAAAGLAAFTAAAFAAVDAASDLREAQSLSTQVFEENAAQMEVWAAGAADAFGQSEREALNFAAGFGTAFKNVGMDLDDAAAKSQDLTRLAADLGSAFNRSSEEAATALRGGLLGESEPMRKFGVFLSEAAVGAKAVAMGIAKAGKELTDTQKVAARYALIMEQTADSQGMFGRDTESLADAQKALAAEMENLGAEMGEVLLPVMVEIVDFAREDIIPALRALAEAVGAVDDAFGFMGGIPGLLGAVTSAGASTTAMISRQAEEARAAAEAQRELGVELGDTWARGGHEAIEAARDLARATDDVGDSATEAADRVKLSAGAIAKASRDMVDGLVTDAKRVIDEYYGPIEAAAELAATKREIAEQEQIASSAASTAAQVTDARTRVTELQHTEMDLLAELGGFGDLTSAHMAEAMATFKEGWADMNEATRDQAYRSIKALEALRLAQITALGQQPSGAGGLSQGDRVSGPGYSGTRARGGPVYAGEAYLVGENGPEVLQMGATGGYVDPGGGGGSATIEFHSHIYLDGREIADVVDMRLAN